MSPQELERLYSQVNQIKRLDSTLERMAKGAESNIEELGEKVISVIGRNVLDKRKDWVGDVVFCALFNALRHQREQLRHELSGSVEITECYHKIQEVLAHEQ